MQGAAGIILQVSACPGDQDLEGPPVVSFPSTLPPMTEQAQWECMCVWGGGQGETQVRERRGQ